MSICNHAELTHTFLHNRPRSCTTTDSLACVYFSASVNMCTYFWKVGTCWRFTCEHRTRSWRAAGTFSPGHLLILLLSLGTERVTESYKQLLFPILRILWYKWICMSSFFPRALAVCSTRWALRNTVLRIMLSFSPRHQGTVVFNLFTFSPCLRRKHLNILCSSSCNMAITSLWKLFYFQYFMKYVKIHIWLVKMWRAGTLSEPFPQRATPR